ncbi:MAG: hypothetical protein CR993_08525 [Rhodobacterales bacterium]|nr:MAG: hypothetical protein CR993_08525 [Rhodobacterales bacterium]
MAINWKPTWEREEPAEIIFNQDGSVHFDDLVGDVWLPEDYKEFMLYSNGLGTKDTNSWFVSDYPNGPKILELEYLSEFFSVKNGTLGFQVNMFHDGYTVPKGYIDIGTAEGDANYTSVLLSVRKEAPDYGQVFTWMQTQDPWMEGENTTGLGFVANSFTEFMNNLTARENL